MKLEAKVGYQGIKWDILDFIQSHYPVVSLYEGGFGKRTLFSLLLLKFCGSMLSHEVFLSKCDSSKNFPIVAAVGWNVIVLAVLS